VIDKIARSSALLLELGPMKIKPILVDFRGEQGSMLSLVLIKNPECANSCPENPPNRILNRFVEFNCVVNKMQLESQSSSRN